MKLSTFSKVLLTSLIMCGTTMTFASIKVTGTIPTMVPIKQNYNGLLRAAPVLKPITLQKIELSPDSAAWLAQEARKEYRPTIETSATPPQVSLGMNKVPVLDQGAHGTCATFAVTGSIDAIYGKSDYVSQLCNLSLGLFLENKSNGKYHSGWDGSINEWVFDQIEEYGFVSMEYQKKYGCGSSDEVLKTYPLNKMDDHGFPMSDTDFKKVSQLITNDVSSKIILNMRDAFSRKTKMDKVFSEVKQALSKEHRVVLGTLLDISDDLQFVNGATGTYHVQNDSWVVTPKIKKNAVENKINAGHALIITGYDDNAVIIGEDGKKHKGMFILRNSWSNVAGDKGDYYMSYEFFKLLAAEVMEITPSA